MLVGDQRDERAHDDGEPAEREPRGHVAERLAGAGRHHGDGVAARHGGLDGLALARAENVDPELREHLFQGPRRVRQAIAAGAGRDGLAGSCQHAGRLAHRPIGRLDRADAGGEIVLAGHLAGLDLGDLVREQRARGRAEGAPGLAKPRERRGPRGAVALADGAVERDEGGVRLHGRSRVAAPSADPLRVERPS